MRSQWLHVSTFQNSFLLGASSLCTVGRIYLKHRHVNHHPYGKLAGFTENQHVFLQKINRFDGKWWKIAKFSLQKSPCFGPRCPAAYRQWCDPASVRTCQVPDFDHWPGSGTFQQPIGIIVIGYNQSWDNFDYKWDNDGFTPHRIYIYIMRGGPKIIIDVDWMWMEISMRIWME